MSGLTKKKRSPCVGICSTTYGDLVCRGCRRFSHEIVGWNGYTEEQKALILVRLKQLKRGVLTQYLEIFDTTLFDVCCDEFGFKEGELFEKVYAVLAYLVSKSKALSSTGLKPCSHALDIEDPAELMRFVESEMYLRSQALYERNFKVIV